METTVACNRKRKPYTRVGADEENFQMRTKEEKREARLAKNRKAAADFRKRQRDNVTSLECQVINLSKKLEYVKAINNQHILKLNCIHTLLANLTNVYPIIDLTNERMHSIIESENPDLKNLVSEINQMIKIIFNENIKKRKESSDAARQLFSMLQGFASQLISDTTVTTMLQISPTEEINITQLHENIKLVFKAIVDESLKRQTDQKDNNLLLENQRLKQENKQLKAEIQLMSSDPFKAKIQSITSDPFLTPLEL